jgi:hypothetical protein
MATLTVGPDGCGGTGQASPSQPGIGEDNRLSPLFDSRLVLRGLEKFSLIPILFDRRF